MDYPQILCKTILNLKVTTIILLMHQHFDIRYGLQTVSYMAPKIWEVVRKEME